MNLENIEKIYNEGKSNELKVLKCVNVNFESGKMYAIMGRSGSGKTTLINILGLLDSKTSGTYTIDGVSVDTLNSREKAIMRNQKIGFVFQSYYLDELLTALENVELPMLMNLKISKKERKEKALSLLSKFNLQERADHYPKELSGGECQRIAIARAIVNNPSIIIADEPTGNLDKENEIIIFELLKDIAKDGKCVIVVSHNPLVKEYADIIYSLDDGVITSEV